MAKTKVLFICSKCGYISNKWLGRCPECNSWDSFDEQIDSKSNSTRLKISEQVKPLKIKDLNFEKNNRVFTDIPEFDQLMGGGIVEGSVVLVGGEPGIGKSTIMLQIASKLSQKSVNVLYTTSEESYEQIKLRANRLNLQNIDFLLLATNRFENIISAINEKKIDFLIIDSIQTIYADDIDAIAGTVSQVRYITYKLVEIAKSNNITIFIIGQITKEGFIAGPKVLEHLVDTVLYFEGDYSKGYRILRATKNRYGPTNMVALFEMRDKGLVPLEFNKLYTKYEVPGKVMTIVMEGNRPLIIEIQSLVANSFFNYPRRNTTGFDISRLNMLIALIDKRCGFNISNYDVYINIAGGLKITETAADLATVVSIVSAYKNITIPNDTIFIGEVNLSGFISPVSFLDNRLAQAKQYGFKKAFIPTESKVDNKKGIDLIYIKSILELINYI